MQLIEFSNLPVEIIIEAPQQDDIIKIMVHFILLIKGGDNLVDYLLIAYCCAKTVTNGNALRCSRVLCPKVK